jgi:hypothetical protein
LYKLGDRHDELNISFSDNFQYRFSQMINDRDKHISIVIVDTLAIQYGYQLDLFNLFLKLYSQIIISTIVASEISQGLALGVSLPDLNTFTWVKIANVSTKELIPTLPINS